MLFLVSSLRGGSGLGHCMIIFVCYIIDIVGSHCFRWFYLFVRNVIDCAKNNEFIPHYFCLFKCVLSTDLAAGRTARKFSVRSELTLDLEAAVRRICARIIELSFNHQ